MAMSFYPYQRRVVSSRGGFSSKSLPRIRGAEFSEGGGFPG